MTIQILIDNPTSWMVPYAEAWVHEWRNTHVHARLVHKVEHIVKGDLLFLMSCEQKFTETHLNTHNVVIHASALPKGRGWSPLTWQVLEGKNEITVSAIEATAEIDAGPVLATEVLKTEPHQLIEELRDELCSVMRQLADRLIDMYPNISLTPQKGEPTYFRKRSAADSRLDVHKSIADQFALLRVVDNERYPAWFELNGHTYTLKIEKVHRDEDSV